jgi:hypothetical protein
MSIIIEQGITIQGGITIGAGGPPVPNGSALFDASGQYLSTQGGAATAMGTGSFTWECWVYVTGNSTYAAFIDTRGVQTGYSVTDNDGAYLGLEYGNLLPMYYQNGALIASSIAVASNAWTHVALVRDGTATTLYVGGQIGGTYASDTINFSAPYVDIGGTNGDSGLRLSGYISNLRMVKGVAVYTAPFAPPIADLPATQIANAYGNPSAAITGTQTALLLNTPSGAGFLTDSSTNAFTVINNGSVTSSALAPF